MDLRLPKVCGGLYGWTARLSPTDLRVRRTKNDALDTRIEPDEIRKRCGVSLWSPSLDTRAPGKAQTGGSGGGSGLHLGLKIVLKPDVLDQPKLLLKPVGVVFFRIPQ